MDNFHELLDGIERNIEEHRSLALRLIKDHESYTNVLLTVSKSLLEEENEALSESMSTKNEANPAGEYITTETYTDDFESYLGTWSNINDTSMRRFSKIS